MNTIKFEIEDWSENENEGVNHSEVFVMVDGKCAGFLRVNNENGHIEYVEIYSNYRGKGFYKMLLIAAINLTGLDTLHSNDRNQMSNLAYEKWLGQSLPKEYDVFISVIDEQLNFSL